MVILKYNFKKKPGRQYSIINTCLVPSGMYLVKGVTGNNKVL
jgi:hypothetical protein